MNRGVPGGVIAARVALGGRGVYQGADDAP